MPATVPTISAVRPAGARTEESCTQYNSLKVARHLFTWSADPKLADYYERALLNGTLACPALAVC